MKLWLLKPVEGQPEVNGERWSPSYDEAHGFVIRAENENAARMFAGNDCGYEGEGVWLNPDQTTCVELTGNGESGVILIDFVRG
jgi:hypothetical protein